jgi:hypothetical protein
VRDAIDDDPVTGGLVHPHSSDVHRFGRDVGEAEAIDPRDERGRKTLLHAEQDANPMHDQCDPFLSYGM